MLIRTFRSLGVAALFAVGTLASSALPTAAQGGRGAATPALSANPCVILNGFEPVNPVQVHFGQEVTLTAHLTSCSSEVETVNITYTAQSPLLLSSACDMPSWSVTSIQLKPGDTNKGVSSTQLAPRCHGVYTVNATVTSGSATLVQGSALFVMFAPARNRP